MDKQELLESPFLTDELFSRKTGPEWEGSALSLASQSPFLNALETTDSAEIEELSLSRKWVLRDARRPLQNRSRFPPDRVHFAS